MRFGVEDYSIEVKRASRRKQEVEVFEGLREQKALHRIGFLFGDDALQRRVTFFRATVFHKVAPHRLAHLLIMIWIKLNSRSV